MFIHSILITECFRNGIFFYALTHTNRICNHGIPFKDAHRCFFRLNEKRNKGILFHVISFNFCAGEISLDNKLSLSSVLVSHFLMMASAAVKSSHKTHQFFTR